MRFTINLITPDNGEKFLIEMENATLTNIEGFLSDKPDLTVTINRSDLEQTMMGAKTLEAQIAGGTAKAEGDLGRAEAARIDDGRFRPALPDHAGHEAQGDCRRYGRHFRSRRREPGRGIDETEIAIPMLTVARDTTGG